MQATEDGKGEIVKAVSTYYDNRPVFLFVRGITGSDTGGVTANDLRGAATWIADGNIVAHELGHVFMGLGHPDLAGNLMMDDLTDHVKLDDVPWLNRGQVDSARNRIIRMQWARD